MFFHFYNLNPNSNELIIFHGLYHFSNEKFSEYIKNEHLIHRFPDKIIILLSIQNKDKANVERITEAINNRFRCHSDIYFYNEDGGMVFYNEDGCMVDKDDCTIDGEKFKSLFANGIKQLEEQHTPLIKPTHGHQFLKPSKERGEYFIRLDNMLIKESEISFMALLIIRKFGNTLNKDVINIYVDTPDLFYLMRLCCAIKFNDRRKFPHIKSFNSYDGYQKVLPTESENSIVVISASSSGNLPRKITSEFEKYQKNKILTILSTNEDDSFTLLHKLKFDDTDTQSEKSDAPLIKIYGEKFIVSHEEDKWVLLQKIENSPWLKDRNKKNRGFVRFKSLITEQENIILEKNINFENGTIEHPIKINTENLLKNKKFEEWCHEAINWHMPQTTKLVIYLNEKSKNFLDENPILKNVKKILFDRESNIIEEIVNEILSSEEKLSGFSILVFAPVLSYGSVFTEISRELRKYEKILNINYIAGICTVPNMEVFNTFKKNIEMSNSYKYNFHNYFTMNIGSFRNFSEDFRKEKEIIGRAIEEKIIKSREEFMPKKCIFCKDLNFADGFVFWDKKTFKSEYPEELQQISVFSTVAMVLQHSRELPVNDEYSLQLSHTNGVVLSPENFFRFNDTMIQAAILRSAQLQELNYASNKEKSISMRYFILNSIKNPSLFYEILLSMATKKLLLHGEINIKEEIQKKLKEGSGSESETAQRYWDIFKSDL